jgi:hypothetical protein
MRWYTRNHYYWNKLQPKLLKRSTTDTPNRTLMERVRAMVLRLATINNVLPFPLTIHATKNVTEFLHPKLLQGPLESILRLPHPMILLHLLEEVRGMEP